MTDPIVTIYDRIIAMLKAEPTLYDATATDRNLVYPKNLITYSGTQPYPEKPNRGDGDFPELDVDEGAYQDTGVTKWPNFGDCVVQQITQNFVLTLTMRDNRLVQASNLRFAISKALSKGGKKLGLSTLVQSWGPITGSGPIKSDVKASPTAEGTTRRRVLKLNVPVVVLLSSGNIQN